MTLPPFYPTVRIPMYILTRVTPNGNLVFTEYKTRAELMEIMATNNLSPVLSGDDFVTSLYYTENGDRLIVTTIYLQNSIFNNKED